MSWAPVARLAGAPVTVAYHTGDPRLVYAYLHCGGLMRSRDDGETWQAVGLAPRQEQGAVALAAGPGEHVVVALSDGDIMRSRDGGRTWQKQLDRGRPVVAR